MPAENSFSNLIHETAEGLFGTTALSQPADALPAFTNPQGPGPSPLDMLPAPEDYGATFKDAARASALSILSDEALHYTLYGRQQGRALLAKITPDIKRVVMIAPSYLKQCGIGEYGRYLSSELAKQVEEVRVVRTSSAAIDLGAEFLKDALVLVNHGPGLFDGLNPRLSQGESTTRLLQNLDLLARDFGAIPLIIHHSLLDTDHDLLFSRQQQIMNSNIPSVAFISSAGRHFFIPTMELGVSPVSLPPIPEAAADATPDKTVGKKTAKKSGKKTKASYPKGPYVPNRDERPEVVGFFGFFQYGGKDFDSLFHLVRELRGKLVGSVATSNADELARFNETLAHLDLPSDLGTGWVDDTELLARLHEADYFYLPQNDYDHWNNSATARFVTNLDRPLFLPPHHPFLDMDDGAIFASKEDLPRIVAHFREEGHFAEAVRRVQAFRARADMANTAKAVRTGMVTRTADVGQALLETPSALSAERFEELPGPARDAFAQTLGAPKGADLDTVLPHLPALYRAPAPRQYWRKHYELGDFVHGTLLENLHAAYMNCAKRPITFREMIGVLNSALNTEGGPLWQIGDTTRAAILRALDDKGGLFFDPEIVFLDNGALADDWQALLAPERIEDFAKAKTARRAAVQAATAKSDPVWPEITNLAELLLIPAPLLRQRSAPIDLSLLDLDAVQAVRKPSQRLNRLIAQANDAGLRLGDHLVFDHLQVPEINPRVTHYAIEDFLYYSGDMFILNAVRCIDKRNPFAIEAMGLNSMLNTLGMAAVLQHLLLRAEGRITVAGFDKTRDMEGEAEAFRRFMDAARDPLFGLIEARNTYEVQKRNNGRWWLANKESCDALWHDSGSNMGVLSLTYALLSESPAERANPRLRRDNPVWQMDSLGRFRRAADTLHDGLALKPGKTLTLSPNTAGAFETASAGFYPTEEAGVWTRGLEGSIVLQLDPEALPTAPKDGAKALRLTLGFFGSSHFEGQRKMTLSLLKADLSALALFDVNGTEEPPLASTITSVTRDAPIEVDLPLEALQEAGPYTLRLEIDRGTSPMEAGLSPDERQLGILVKTLTLAPLPAAAPSRSEGPEDGAKEVREDGPEDDGQTATTPEVA